MIYVLETKLLESVSVYYALKKVYGLGKFKSFYFCKQLGLARNLKVSKLTDEQISKFLKLVESSKVNVTSDLKKMNRSVLNRLVTIKSYRGLRKIKGLPVRGQRTHTNAKTASRIKKLSN